MTSWPRESNEASGRQQRSVWTLRGGIGSRVGGRGFRAGRDRRSQASLWASLLHRSGLPGSGTVHRVRLPRVSLKRLFPMLMRAPGRYMKVVLHSRSHGASPPSGASRPVPREGLSLVQGRGECKAEPESGQRRGR